MPKRASALRAGCLLFSLALASTVFAQWNPLNPVASVKQQDDGVVLAMQKGTLRLQICSDSIVRVTYSPAATFPNTPQYAITKTNWPKTQWTMQSSDNEVSVTTSSMKATITRKDGAILFSDAGGKKLFQDYGRTLTPV